MADVTIDATVLDAIGVFCPRGLVWTSTTTAYAFYVDTTSGDVSYSKTTDGGQTWGSPVAAIVLGTGPCCFDIWFDKWTPGDTGTTIHILALDTAADDVLYRGFNTSNDTFVAATNVCFAGSTAAAGQAMQISITKSGNGNLYAIGTIDNGTEDFHRTSANLGVTWANIGGTAIAIDAGDKLLLFPSNGSGSDEFIVLFFDSSALDLLVYGYTADGGTLHGPTTINASVSISSAGVHPYFNGAPRHSDGRTIVAVWSEMDTATADLLCYEITYAGSGAPSSAAKTTINTNSEDCILCTVTIDQNNDDIYVGYLGKADSSEAWTSGIGASSDIGASYKKSTDDATSWGSEVLLSQTRTYYLIWMQGCPSITTGRFLTTWFEGDNDDLLTNYVNSVEIGGLAITDVESDEVVENRDRAITVTGTGFKAAQGDGTVELANNAVYASATEIVPQTVLSWSDTVIDIIVQLTDEGSNTLTAGTVYVFVKNSDEVRNSTGFAITVNDVSAIKFVNIAKAQSGISGNTATTFIPAGARGGDLAIAGLVRLNNEAFTSGEPYSDGWTSFSGYPKVQNVGGVQYQVDLVYMILGGGGADVDPVWRWTSSAAWATFCALYVGQHASAWNVQLVDDYETTQNDQPVHPGVTVQRSNSALLLVHANKNNNTNTPPSGFTLRDDAGAEIALLDDLTTSPGSTGTITGNLSDPEYPATIVLEIAREAGAQGAYPFAGHYPAYVNQLLARGF